VARSSERN